MKYAILKINDRAFRITDGGLEETTVLAPGVIDDQWVPAGPLCEPELQALKEFYKSDFPLPN